MTGPNKRENSIHCRIDDDADERITLLSIALQKDKATLASELLDMAIAARHHTFSKAFAVKFAAVKSGKSRELECL